MSAASTAVDEMASCRCRGRSWRSAPGALLTVLCCVLAVGCSADEPLNPSFPLTMADAQEAMREMRDEPVPLQRPLVIAGGIHDPGFAPAGLRRRLGAVTNGDHPIIEVSFLGEWTFDACRSRLIRAVDAAMPSDDPQQTIEVDVVAFSMGGLVARYAARPCDDGGPALCINRLFTIASPHRGAPVANLPTFDARAIDMRPESEFLQELDETEATTGYQLFSYVRLGDSVVGEENAAPPGRKAWWVANPPFSFAHLWASSDARILADIARRLRGEEPYSMLPAAPAP
ncbi:MAG: lipase family alpha/beta hydrolase [Planctomycetota bacterium]|jgi:hypothetical protein